VSIFQLIPSHTQNRQILTLEEMSKNAIIDTPRMTHLSVSYVKRKGKDYFWIDQDF
jgi:hypothetical protein